MANQVGVKFSSADEHPGLVLTGLLIAVIGFFIVAILYAVDGLVGDVTGDVAGFPGLKQILNLLGTIADTFSKLISGIVSIFTAGASSGN